MLTAPASNPNASPTAPTSVAAAISRDLADGLQVAPQLARKLGALDVGHGTQLLQNGQRASEGVGVAAALAVGVELLDVRQDVVLGFRAKAVQVGEAARLGGFFQCL